MEPDAIRDNQGRNLAAVKRHQARAQVARAQGCAMARARFDRDVADAPLPDWAVVHGQLVLRSGDSPHLAVPIGGRKSAKVFDVVNLATGQLVTQLRNTEVHRWLWAVAKAESEALHD